MSPWYNATMYVIAGLGNPGNEYENTRHNTGRMALEFLRKKIGAEEWRTDKKLAALLSAGVIEAAGKKITLIEPETFMNKSGLSLAPIIKTKKAAEELIVIYDDLDLPIGSMKISFNRSSGGHRGVESIIGSLKTEAFVRIRVGIAPVTPSGKIKKPSGDEAVAKFILAKFKPTEQAELKKVFKKIPDAIATIISAGRERAMGEFNAG